MERSNQKLFQIDKLVSTNQKSNQVQHRSILFFLFLLFCSHTSAQFYAEQMDSLSKIISNIQLTVDGKKFVDADENVFRLSFPEDNFKVWSQDRLATVGMYRQKGENELFFLSEEVDLAKAIRIEPGYSYDGIGTIKIWFPAKSIEVQVLDTAGLKESQDVSYIELYYAQTVGMYTPETDPAAQRLMDVLYTLIIQLNIAKAPESGEHMARFLGGTEGWTYFLRKHVRTTVPGTNNAPTGMYRVTVAFHIDKDGNISDVRAENDPGYGTAAEAVRVMKKSPRWIPAVQNGRPVALPYKQQIVFAVNNEDE